MRATFLVFGNSTYAAAVYGAIASLNFDLTHNYCICFQVTNSHPAVFTLMSFSLLVVSFNFAVSTTVFNNRCLGCSLKLIYVNIKPDNMLSL